MTAISPKFSQTGGPVLNVDDAGGEGLPVIFQHGLCGDARQTIEAFPRDPHFRRITIESRGHGGSEARGPPPVLDSHVRR
jgi:pimeloyl-ACP methyl ester carboxylesterase